MAKAREDSSPEKLAGKFAKLVDKQLGEFVKAVVLFGSCAKQTTTGKSDIDVLVIVDDVGVMVDERKVVEYKEKVQKAAERTSLLLHINTLKLTNFWEYCREGDPVVLNMLRDGEPLLDRGFFLPMQVLLKQGRIRPTKEAIWTYYARTSNTLRSAQKHLLSACVDLYWAAIDASHAALMAVGEVPPSPEHVADLLEKVLVKRRMLEARFPAHMRELYHLNKAIQHREVREISGEQFDGYFNETLRLVDALRTIVEMHPAR